jgi:thioredoxin reductase
VEEVLNNTVQEIQGKDLMEKIILSSEYKGKKELSVSGVFVEIGLIPATALAVPLGVKLDENGYITVDARMETNVSGVFAAGDLALVPGSIPFRQIVTSAGQGAMAAAAAHQYLRRQAPAPNWG